MLTYGNLTFENSVEYLTYIRDNTDIEVLKFMENYDSIKYIREFLLTAYTTFEKHDAKTRVLLAEIARQFSKAMTIIFDEVQQFSNIDIDIFVSVVKILLNDLEENCIKHKTDVTYTNVQNGAIELQITLSSYDQLNVLKEMNIVEMIKNKELLYVDININNMLNNIMDGITFAGMK